MFVIVPRPRNVVTDHGVYLRFSNRNGIYIIHIHIVIFYELYDKNTKLYSLMNCLMYDTVQIQYEKINLTSDEYMHPVYHGLFSYILSICGVYNCIYIYLIMLYSQKSKIGRLSQTTLEQILCYFLLTHVCYMYLIVYACYVTQKLLVHCRCIHVVEYVQIHSIVGMHATSRVARNGRDPRETLSTCACTCISRKILNIYLIITFIHLTSAIVVPGRIGSSYFLRREYVFFELTIYIVILYKYVLLTAIYFDYYRYRITSWAKQQQKCTIAYSVTSIFRNIIYDCQFKKYILFNLLICPPKNHQSKYLHHFHIQQRVSQPIKKRYLVYGCNGKKANFVRKKKFRKCIAADTQYLHVHVSSILQIHLEVTIGDTLRHGIFAISALFEPKITKLYLLKFALLYYTDNNISIAMLFCYINIYFHSNLLCTFIYWIIKQMYMLFIFVYTYLCLIHYFVYYETNTSIMCDNMSDCGNDCNDRQYFLLAMKCAFMLWYIVIYMFMFDMNLVTYLYIGLISKSTGTLIYMFFLNSHIDILLIQVPYLLNNINICTLRTITIMKPGRYISRTNCCQACIDTLSYHITVLFVCIVIFFVHVLIAINCDRGQSIHFFLRQECLGCQSYTENMSRHILYYSTEFKCLARTKGVLRGVGDFNISPRIGVFLTYTDYG